MKYSHSFHSFEAEKGTMSFTFGHTHPGVVGNKSASGGGGGGGDHATFRGEDVITRLVRS